MSPIVCRLSFCLLVALCLGWAAGCGQPEAASENSSLLLVDLDKGDPERLLRYYLGGYASAASADPFEAGLLVAQANQLYLDAEELEARQPGLGERLRSTAGDRRLAWKELADFLHATYYDARALPTTLDAFRRETPYLQGDSAWFHIEIDGVMTTARRHVYVPIASLRSALSNYQSNEERLLYPAGTTIVGEHLVEGDRVETTVMKKRADGFWDFFTYGPDGTLAGETQALPRSLKTPTQCVGCHFGNKLFEPERSFPGTASDGPHGPRALYVPEAWRDAEVVRFFDEHRKRSDTVLGLYSTLFVAHLRTERRAGRLAPEDARLLDALGL